MKKWGPIFVSTIIVSGCQIFPTVEPLPMYHLQAEISQARQSVSPSTIVVAIDIPVCDASLNTANIVYSSAPYRREYYANIQWTDRLPKIIQNFLIQSFENSGYFKTIISAGTGISSPVILQTDIADFSVYYLKDKSPYVAIDLRLQLFDLTKRSVIKAWNIKENYPIKDDSAQAVIEGYNQALSKAIQPITLEANLLLKKRETNPF